MMHILYIVQALVISLVIFLHVIQYSQSPHFNFFHLSPIHFLMSFSLFYIPATSHGPVTSIANLLPSLCCFFRVVVCCFSLLQVTKQFTLVLNSETMICAIWFNLHLGLCCSFFKIKMHEIQTSK